MEIKINFLPNFNFNLIVVHLYLINTLSLKQIGHGNFSEKDNTSETLQLGDSEDELESLQDGRITDIESNPSQREMESTTRDIEYLKISGEITDESESNETLFFTGNDVTDNISSGRRSNCSMNQSNYVSDGPLSESEASAMNDSFYSCNSKFDEGNSEEKMDILVPEASSPKKEVPPFLDSDVPVFTRTRSFFNKMVDKEGNLRPLNINDEDTGKKRHAR